MEVEVEVAVEVEVEVEVTIVTMTIVDFFKMKMPLRKESKPLISPGKRKLQV